MRYVASLVALTALAVVSQACTPKPAVPVVKAEAVASFTTNGLLNVGKSATPMPGHEAPKPVATLHGGLSHVQKAFKRPIVAMTETDGWFFYATVAFLGDAKDGEGAFFISGYAMKRGSRQVVEWSVW
jgi:hypothetical protein